MLLTHHWGDSPTRYQWQTEKYTGTDFSADYHTFALDWEPDHLAWYVDGVERHWVSNYVPQNTPMFVLANRAVGGDLPDSPDKATYFPAALNIDYIRVFRRTNAPP